MDWDVLIPILMFAFPVAVAILDKRVKKRRQESSAQPRPPFPSANRPWSPYPPAANTTAAEVAPGNRATLGTVRGGTASEAQRWGPTQSDVSRGELPSRMQQAEEILRQAQDDSSRNDERTNEGQRAISRERHQEVVPDKKDPEPKLRIDKKNLILYSEILKPKFDA